MKYLECVQEPVDIDQIFGHLVIVTNLIIGQAQNQPTTAATNFQMFA